MSTSHVRRTREQVQELARQALRDHDLYSIPVNPLEVARRRGVTVLNAVFRESSMSGMTARRSGSDTILVRQLDPPTRKRFTIAHELGHALLHLQDDSDEFIDSDADFFRTSDLDAPDATWDAHRTREWEANVFAAELLMPRELVGLAWAELPDERRVPAVLAHHFQVSEAAMAIRLRELRLI